MNSECVGVDDGTVGLAIDHPVGRVIRPMGHRGGLGLALHGSPRPTRSVPPTGWSAVGRLQVWGLGSEGFLCGPEGDILPSGAIWVPSGVPRAHCVCREAGPVPRPSARSSRSPSRILALHVQANVVGRDGWSAGMLITPVARRVPHAR